MAIGLDEVWRHHRAFTRFRAFSTFEGDAIVLGAGTKMLDLARMVGAPQSDAWARMTALLKAAGYEPPSQTTRLHVQTALLDWWRGDRALAQLRLALLPLPALRRVEDAYPLFLAEHLLDQGMAPDELLRALETPSPGPRSTAHLSPACLAASQAAASGRAARDHRRRSQPCRGRHQVSACNGRAKPFCQRDDRRAKVLRRRQTPPRAASSNQCSWTRSRKMTCMRSFVLRERAARQRHQLRRGAGCDPVHSQQFRSGLVCSSGPRLA